MKAIMYTRNGPAVVLRLIEVPKPEPREDQVLVRVYAASVNTLDLFKRINKVPGADIAGRVEAVGATVTQFQPGDEVFGVPARFAGGFAEYTCVPEGRLAGKPTKLSFEAAAAVPVAAMTALQGLRDKGKIRPGHKVLINGASGGVGTFAVQIAKSFGADVTAVCSARNLPMARSIGADHVIDYAREDFTQNGQRYDLIIGVNGYHSILDYRRALAPRGRYVAIGGSKSQVLQGIFVGPVLSMIGRNKMGFMGIARPNQKDLVTVKEFVEAGKVAPVIDRSYPLAEAVEAIRYLAEGHATGKVILIADHNHRIRQGPDQNQLGGDS
ncbi:MAG TPA: NAD(P)-dependent alcohol dehydrogenase [Anaerolineales bacterium]|nr:NAD(P)-dependent alcohol dehydrogenase [Anaerolineales bacterium]